MLKNKDIDREILLKLSDLDLIKMCNLNRYFRNTLCDDNFFHKRLQQKYPDTLRNNSKYILPSNYKFWYLKVIRCIVILKEKYNYIYTEGNPIVQLEIFHTGHFKNEINDMFIESADSGEIVLVKYFFISGMDRHIKNRALLKAVTNGYIEVVKYLVEVGADIHIENNLVLHLAIRNNYLELVKYLVGQGIKYNDRNNLVLKIAKQHGQLNLIQYLESLN